MTRRPSRPVQASPVPGARWVYFAMANPWWALASADAAWGWVERLDGRWHARVAHRNPSRLQGRSFHFPTKRRAMRWLETIAIKADRAWRAQQRRRVQVFVEDLLTFSTTVERIDVVDPVWVSRPLQGDAPKAVTP